MKHGVLLKGSNLLQDHLLASENKTNMKYCFLLKNGYIFSTKQPCSWNEKLNLVAKDGSPLDGRLDPPVVAASTQVKNITLSMEEVAMQFETE